MTESRNSDAVALNATRSASRLRMGVRSTELNQPSPWKEAVFGFGMRSQWRRSNGGIRLPTSILANEELKERFDQHGIREGKPNSDPRLNE
ncbi:MAG: hypothetical protein U0V48_17335 [Anaerolineales bacterium]